MGAVKRQLGEAFVDFDAIHLAFPEKYGMECQDHSEADGGGGKQGNTTVYLVKQLLALKYPFLFSAHYLNFLIGVPFKLLFSFCRSKSYT